MQLSYWLRKLGLQKKIRVNFLQNADVNKEEYS